jgi:hypothetical protein
MASMADQGDITLLNKSEAAGLEDTTLQLATAMGLPPGLNTILHPVQLVLKCILFEVQGQWVVSH